jgi:hypothetical protein
MADRVAPAQSLPVAHPLVEKGAAGRFPDFARSRASHRLGPARGVPAGEEDGAFA